MLRALGVIPWNTDWKGLLIHERTKVIEGVWIARTNQLFLKDRIERDRESLTCHELVHALQDKHLDLDGLLAFVPGDSDRHAARLHLVEGDAVETVRRIWIPEREMPDVVPTPEAFEPPPYLTRMLQSPYDAGPAFVRTLLDAGGNSARNAAFKNPPVSTEQVLHPEKYLAGEKPLTVLLPLLPRAGAVWEHIDTFGQLALRNALKIWMRSRGVRSSFR